MWKNLRHHYLPGNCGIDPIKGMLEKERLELAWIVQNEKDLSTRYMKDLSTRLFHTPGSQTATHRAKHSCKAPSLARKQYEAFLWYLLRLCKRMKKKDI